MPEPGEEEKKKSEYSSFRTLSTDKPVVEKLKPTRTKSEVKEFRGDVVKGFITTGVTGAETLTLTKDDQPFRHSTKLGEISGWKKLGTQLEEKQKLKASHLAKQELKKSAFKTSLSTFGAALPSGFGSKKTDIKESVRDIAGGIKTK